MDLLVEYWVYILHQLITVFYLKEGADFTKIRPCFLPAISVGNASQGYGLTNCLFQIGN